MASDHNSLLSNLEKQLGRDLTLDEKRLIVLAEEIMEKEKRAPAAEAKSAGAE